MNAFSIFQESMQIQSDRLALISGTGKNRRTVSFAELGVQVDNVAAQLRHFGLQSGDRILLAVPVSIETYVVMLAVMKAGMVTMFVDPAHPAARVAAILKSWPPAAVVSTGRILLFRFLRKELRKIPLRLVVNGNSSGATPLSFTTTATDRTGCEDRSSADSALLTFTSGSTGEPKPVLRTHGFLRRQMDMIEKIAKLEESDIDFVAMPMFVLFNLAQSVTSVIPATNTKRPGKADPNCLFAQMADECVTRTVASPALLERLANHCLVKQRFLPELSCISTGGGPVAPTLARKLKIIAPNAVIRMVYGSTEAEPIACIDDCEVSIGDRNNMQRGAGLLVGKTVDGCDVRIIHSQPCLPVTACTEETLVQIEVAAGEIGEIVVSGKHVLGNYADAKHNRLTKFSVEGTVWHRTGDAGYCDRLGRLWLVGRCSASISDERGSVFPFQVEFAVSAVKGIRRAALASHRQKRVLVVETDKFEFRSECAAAVQCAVRHEIDRIVAVRRIPMDRRHDAKVDYFALHRLLDGGIERWRFQLVEAVSFVYHTLHRILTHLIAALSRGIGGLYVR